MQSYVNKFNIALNQDKTEAIVNFFQNVPIIPQNDGSPEVKIEADIHTEIIPVANLAMTGECARNFATMLLSLLDQDISKTE